MHFYAQIAQLVEQWTENPRVTGSIPVLGTIMREWLSGGVSPCQGEGRGFESRLVLSMIQKRRYPLDTSFFVCSTQKGGRKMKKTDLLLVAGALIIAGGIWFFYSAGAEKGKGVEITVDGESKAFLPLGEDDSIRIDTDGGYNVITVKDGEVTVSEADCRDQICVEHKKIRKTGETIVCLPHKLVVTVTGDEPGDFDAVVM